MPRDRCGVLDGDTVAAATIAVIDTDRALHLAPGWLVAGLNQAAAAQGGALGQILPGVAEVRLSLMSLPCPLQLRLPRVTPVAGLSGTDPPPVRCSR